MKGITTSYRTLVCYGVVLGYECRVWCSAVVYDSVSKNITLTEDMNLNVRKVQVLPRAQCVYLLALSLGGVPSLADLPWLSSTMCSK